MRVGIIGLGAIAQKAYLPVLTSMPGVTPVLVTRTPRTLIAVGDAYRVRDLYGSVSEAIASGLDAAFVHTPSPTHPAIVAELLNAGVPVLVDKPLATDQTAAHDLAVLAAQLRVSLMVGFNRRYAPAYRTLSQWGDLDVVTLTKHRESKPGLVRDMVFDDFIHVIDTLRFLVPSEMADLVVSTSVDDRSRCRRLAIQFTGNGCLAVGIMSWTAGATQEVLDVIGDGRRRTVTDLADVVDLTGVEQLVRRDGWAPATRLRGFEAMCGEFLDAVSEGRLLDATDAALTHEVCERVVLDALLRKDVDTAVKRPRFGQGRRERSPR
ncbi:Gfo/Idh/MocA family oxidoreductase [Pengzhenrongella sp.]|jgi:virulence factor|uniref:Gfo/Idh/MocA family protein n=1 Tax=Pengzhenrongella sp. TaxID=2888820 RepID=UPI002F953902